MSISLNMYEVERGLFCFEFSGSKASVIYYSLYVMHYLLHISPIKWHLRHSYSVDILQLESLIKGRCTSCCVHEKFSVIFHMSL